MVIFENWAAQILLFSLPVWDSSHVLISVLLHRKKCPTLLYINGEISPCWIAFCLGLGWNFVIWPDILGEVKCSQWAYSHMMSFVCNLFMQRSSVQTHLIFSGVLCFTPFSSLVDRFMGASGFTWRSQSELTHGDGRQTYTIQRHPQFSYRRTQDPPKPFAALIRYPTLLTSEQC